jgi:hypothetical protein
MRNALIALVFQLGWFACVLSGARGHLLSAIAAATAVIAVNLWLLRGRLTGVIRLMAWVTLVGFVVESINLRAGVFTLAIPSIYPWLCPVWLVLLWTMFATVLRGPLAWLTGRYALSLLLGVIFAVPNYFAGARLGAVKLNAPIIYSVIILMVLWAIAMPVMVWLSEQPQKN